MSSTVIDAVVTGAVIYPVLGDEWEMTTEKIELSKRLIPDINNRKDFTS